MIQKKVWRYYCEFCRKGGCAKGHAASHEKHCIWNPQRECRMCEHATGEKDQTKPVGDLVAALDSEGGLAALKTLAQNCPACILSAIVQQKKRLIAEGKYDENHYVDYDFKTAREAMWEDVNSMRAEEEHERNRHVEMYP